MVKVLVVVCVIMVLADVRCMTALVVRLYCWLLGLGGDTVGGGVDVMIGVVVGRI